jgi:hypothetical protein
MKSAGKSKAAVMNSRSPKKPMAISGDTMSNYAMYKKGGKVKKSLNKAQIGGMPRPMDPMSSGNSMSSLDRLKLEQAARNKELQQQWSEERNQKLLEQARKEHDLNNPKSSSYGSMKQTGYKVPVSSSGTHEKIDLFQPPQRKKGGATKSKYKSGGTTKKYKSGGGFPDLNKDGKITKADILKGRGVIKKKGGMTKSRKK